MNKLILPLLILAFIVNKMYSQDGEVIWNFKTAEMDWVNPALGPDGTIYITDRAGKVIAVNDKGKNYSIKWKKDATTEYMTLPERAEIIKPFTSDWPGNIDLSESAPTLNREGSRLYFGSHTSPAWVFCVNTTDGSLIWKIRIPDNPLAGYTPGWLSDPRVEEQLIYPKRKWGKGGGIVSSAAFNEKDSTLYIGSGDWSEGNFESNVFKDNKIEYSDIEDNRFFAIKDIGDSAIIKWYFQPDAEPETWPSNTARRSFFGSPAIGPNGTIYIGGFNGYLYAIEDLEKEYRIKWHWLSLNKCNDGIQEQEWWGSPALNEDGHSLYIGSNDGYLHKFHTNAKGKNPPLWSCNTWGEVYATPVITPAGRIIITSEGRAEDDNPYPGCQQWPTSGIGSHIYALIDSGDYYIQDWIFPARKGGKFFFGQATALQNETVIVSAETSNEFWLIDAAKKPPIQFITEPKPQSFLLWRTSTGIETRTSAAVARDGSIYVCGGYTGGLYKIKGSSPLAKTGFPRMQKNNRNSGKW